MADSTFPKSSRLRKRAEFLSLQHASSKFNVQGFLVVWRINCHQGPRLGITVSKKVGPAVVRNRIKRLTREIFRCGRTMLPAVDINVIARRESAAMDFFSIQRELEKVFRCIGASTCSHTVSSI